jgi:hypothetical protein
MFAAIVEFFKNIGTIFTVLKSVMELIKELQRIKEAQRQSDLEKKSAARDAALDSQPQSESEADFDRAQEIIVGNKPV